MQEISPVLKRIRRKKTADRAMLWLAQALVVFLRAIFRVMELVGPKERRPGLRRLRKQLDQLNRERDAITGQIKAGRIFDGLEAMEDLAARHDRSDDGRGFRYIRALRQESEALKAIHDEAGADKALAAQGFRDYVSAHPQSHMAYHCLGGALIQTGDLDAALEADREALRLAEGEPRFASFHRLAIADILHRKGDSGAAVAELRRIIADAAPDTQSEVCLAYFQLGTVLNDSGDRAGAREAWKQAIHWDATKIIAKKAREMLKASP